MTSPPAARSVASWGVLDQIVSSGANFVFVVLAARTLDPDGFGAVALGFEIYLLAVIAARGVAGDTLMARFSAVPCDELGPPTRAASGAAVLVALVVALGALVASVTVDASLRGIMIVLAVAVPLLVVQDFVRQALIVQGRARDAFMNDLAWAVLQVPALVVAAAVDPRPAAMFAAWCAAGAVTACVGVVQVRHGLLPGRGARGWLRDHKTLWPYLLGDNLVYAAGSFVVVIVISAVSGLAGLAAFRVAMTVYAPLATVGRGVVGVAVNLLARRRSEPRDIRRGALFISCVLAPTAIVWGAIVTFLPDSVMEALFGESWASASTLVFLACFPCATALFAVGAASGMRALDAGAKGLNARVLVSVIGLACLTVGVYVDGVRGAFVLFAWSVPVQLFIWWRQLSSATRRAEIQA